MPTKTVLRPSSKLESNLLRKNTMPQKLSGNEREQKEKEVEWIVFG